MTAKHIIIIALGALIIGVAAHVLNLPEVGKFMGALFGAIIILPIYFFPTLMTREGNSKASIFIVNLFFGWTLIGWVVALAWAVMNPPAYTGAAAAPPIAPKAKEKTESKSVTTNTSGAFYLGDPLLIFAVLIVFVIGMGVIIVKTLNQPSSPEYMLYNLDRKTPATNMTGF